MTVKDAVIEKLEHLPISQQQEVLHFAEFLESKVSSIRPRQSLYGSLAHLNIDLTEEDIKEMRKEAWKNFPREHFFDNESK